MYEDRYIKKRDDAIKARPYRAAVFSEFGLTKWDWISRRKHIEARAVTCWIARKKLGLSLSTCAVVCNYPGSATSTAHDATQRVEQSEHLRSIAEHVYNKVAGVCVA